MLLNFIIAQLFASARFDWLIFYEKETDGFIEIVHADVIVGEISCQQKFFSRNFLRVKLNFSCC